MKRILSAVLSLVTVFTVVFSTPACMQVSAAQNAVADNFYFNGSMSKEVLRAYAARAVTASEVCGTTIKNFTLDEDIRSLCRMGAKYIGRAAYYSWTPNMSASDIDAHFDVVKLSATQFHKADPEIILQAGIFECIYRGTVNNTKIPAYVFEAFGLPVENRNFRFDAMASRVGYWSTVSEDSAIPNITTQEAQMYFYYQITRYIDCGFEAFHLGQVGLMMNFNNSHVGCWNTVLQKSREYAKLHARRGVALFDCHVQHNTSGLKIGDNLLFDLQGAPIYPKETTKTGDIMQATVAYSGHPYLGRIAGGNHPLGFRVDNNFTILEFDNWGTTGGHGVSNGATIGIWGYHDITWFALQPESYRNQFLVQSADYLSTNYLDSSGKQQYFLQPPFIRVITTNPGISPTLTFEKDKHFNSNFFYDLLSKTRAQATETGTGYSIQIKRDYRANRQSAGMPIGFNQEDTIRQIFLTTSQMANQSATLEAVVFPYAYKPVEEVPVDKPITTSSKKQTTTTSSKKQTTTTSSKKQTTTTSSKKQTITTGGNQNQTTNNQQSKITSSRRKKNNKNKNKNNKKNQFPWLWVILGGVGGLLVIGGGVFLVIFLMKKKKNAADDVFEDEIETDLTEDPNLTDEEVSVESEGNETFQPEDEI